MIMNESGIHTFCLKRKYSYSEIQNIIEQNKCFCCGKDRYELSSYYQITQYKSRGVGNSDESDLRPSSELADADRQPLFPARRSLSANRSFQAEYGFCRNEALSSLHSQRYRSYEPLKTFKLSRCDLTAIRITKAGPTYANDLKCSRNHILSPVTA